uniref:Uncharacterized protein n=1 Tax=Chrysemys picta bellii TaxID=8478 RepID=A0A8C3EZP7_CHRPI
MKYHLTIITMDIIQKFVQSLWNPGWGFLKRIKIDLTYNPQPNCPTTDDSIQKLCLYLHNGIIFCNKK